MQSIYSFGYKFIIPRGKNRRSVQRRYIASNVRCYSVYSWCVALRGAVMESVRVCVLSMSSLALSIITQRRWAPFVRFRRLRLSSATRAGASLGTRPLGHRGHFPEVTRPLAVSVGHIQRLSAGQPADK